MLNPCNKSPKIFALFIFGLNDVYFLRYIVKGVQDDISSKTIEHKTKNRPGLPKFRAHIHKYVRY